ncbi:MAG: glycosyltransferase family 2 protein [Magnetococcales bacterium]|nr:glycosyltransferase family 2 protein [Magnetococcales bacterium]
MTLIPFAPTLAIIPAYNEAANIFAVVDKLIKLGLHVVVVDDGSMDDTRILAKKAGATVLRHVTNLGYGCALQTGYLYALQEGYQNVVQLDGDGQHDPNSAIELLNELKKNNSDVVIGSRFLTKTGYQVPRLRRIGQSFFELILNTMTGWHITDPTSGLQAMTHEVLKFYCTKVFPDDFPDANILLLLHRKGFRVTEIPAHMYAGTGVSMHSGFFSPIYYVVKMTFSLFMSLVVKLPTDKQK